MIHSDICLAIVEAIKKSNRTTENEALLPWVIRFIKNFSASYRGRKSNSWSYQLSNCKLENLDNEEKRRYLTKKYNDRLLLYSKDKNNPWIIDEKEQQLIKICKKCCLEVRNALHENIHEIITHERTANPALSKKEIKRRKKYLYLVADLAHFTIAEDIETKKPTLLHLNFDQTLFEFSTLLHTDYKTIQHKLKNLHEAQQSFKNPYDYHNRLLSEPESYPAYLSTLGDKLHKFFEENCVFQFFETIWYTLSTHANLLRWISFLFILISLPLCTFSFLVLFSSVLVASYLFIRFLLSIKKTPSNLFITQEEGDVLQRIQQDIINKELYNLEFDLILEKTNHLIINPTCQDKTRHFEEENILDSLQTLQLHDSPIYKYLRGICPKIQFITLFTIKTTNIMVCGYLISWVSAIFFSIVGIASIASFIASPVGVGILIFIPLGFSLWRQLRYYQSNKNQYHEKICSLLNANCDYSYVDSEGKLSQLKLEKWKKFTCLQKEIRLLKNNIKTSLENKSFPSELRWIDALVNEHINNKNVETLIFGKKSGLFTQAKKLMYQLFSFLTGGLYGFNLCQQIAVESNLGFKLAFKLISLPIFILALPLIIINAGANFLTYHLYAEQHDRLFFAEHLDITLESLEDEKKILHYYTTILYTITSVSHGEPCEEEQEKFFHGKNQTRIVGKNKPNLSSSSQFFKHNSMPEAIPSTKSHATNLSEENLPAGLACCSLR